MLQLLYRAPSGESRREANRQIRRGNRLEAYAEADSSNFSSRQAEYAEMEFSSSLESDCIAGWKNIAPQKRGGGVSYRTRRLIRLLENIGGGLSFDVYLDQADETSDEDQDSAEAAYDDTEYQ